MNYIKAQMMNCFVQINRISSERMTKKWNSTNMAPQDILKIRWKDDTVKYIKVTKVNN
jgi:hypothetical protein